tara:strand:+ start:33 stop:392 length:360 start_codon:yes stop_codon:yes gene_type:complete
MKPEERTDTPSEEVPNPQLYPRINQLARISFYIGIGCIVGGIYLGFTAEFDERTFYFCVGLLLISAFGAFCGHCAHKQYMVRRPHQKGEAMFNIGLISCYLSLVWGIVVLGLFLAGVGS